MLGCSPGSIERRPVIRSRPTSATRSASRGCSRRRPAARASTNAALTVAWEVVEAAPEDGLGFDPAGFSKRSATSCLACGSAVDKYVKAEGVGKRMGIMPLGAVLVTPAPPRTRRTVASVAEGDRPQG